jgi:hypothetical protein
MHVTNDIPLGSSLSYRLALCIASNPLKADCGSGCRKVPRDMVVHKDGVTGVEMLFLLVGQPGVITGGLQVTAQGKTTLVWNKTPEFPAAGAPPLPDPSVRP